MLTELLLWFLCLVTEGANYSIYDLICTDITESALTLKPVPDIDGRFVLTWCTEENRDVNKWRLQMYYKSVKPEQCHAGYDGATAFLHSSFEQNVKVDLNCTNICLTATLDAIFGPECYYIDTQQISNDIGTLLKSRQYQYVEENPNFTKNHVNESRASVIYQPDGDTVVLDWILAIPASLYHVYMVNNTDDNEPLDMECRSLSAQRVRCRARAWPGRYHAVFTHDAPWNSLDFVTYKFHYDFTHKGIASGLPVQPQQSSSQWWWAAGAALALALLLALLVLLALLALRAARAGTMRENILRMWIDDIAKRWQRAGNARAAERLVLLYARDCAHATRAARTLAQLLQRVTDCDVRTLTPHICRRWQRAGNARAAERLVLLYARDCAHATRAARTLAQLLQRVTDCDVRTLTPHICRRWQRAGNARAAERLVLLYARDRAHATRAARTLAQLLQRVTDCDVVDLYAPETLAGAAPAGGAWLRALLARAGTRVLLLQSPALALYCARLLPAADGSPTLEAPLLGGRMAWRAPHAADSLLLLALRLLADSAHGEPLPYKKYYVAMTAGLQHDDAVPALTPQRRYRLPHAAATLLRDLSPDPALDPLRDPAARHLLEQYKEAMEDYRQYALDHPNHLFEDLVVE
ncbi:uncharacterized protein LOC112048832 [Bicyclus anynana]|uniref:Uncharacterized protein LOC112048832 n=1 Tax=Bicyclus anynana TaxID=110368 RepID=A0A6J1NB53_BICAN|nr:uncharacterized protein LOC112048832 [Bicyclus anynana]